MRWALLAGVRNLRSSGPVFELHVDLVKYAEAIGACVRGLLHQISNPNNSGVWNQQGLNSISILPRLLSDCLVPRPLRAPIVTLLWAVARRSTSPCRWLPRKQTFPWMLRDWTLSRRLVGFLRTEAQASSQRSRRGCLDWFSRNM